MKYKISLRVLFFVTVSISFIFCQNEVLGKDKIFEFEKRGGLPNFLTKVNHSDSIKVAYLGGSITQQPGWRVYSLEWFKKRFPAVAFTEINAAIGGTGSDFGVFRLRDHVLKYNPDLVFIEFAVNDATATQIKITRSMEGIVRQIWEYNPNIDICFIYTIGRIFLQSEKDGELPQTIKTMEKIADWYQIPSINFGLEVGKQVTKGKLLYKGDSLMLNGVPVFSKDGVHPYIETGHEIYQKVFVRSFIKMNANNNGEHLIPRPLISNNYSNARMIDISEMTAQENWEIIDVKGESALTRFSKYLEKLWKLTPGEELTVNFKGDAFGICDIIGPGTGKVSVKIDDGMEQKIMRFDRFCSSPRMNYLMLVLRYLMS